MVMVRSRSGQTKADKARECEKGITRRLVLAVSFRQSARTRVVRSRVPCFCARDAVRLRYEACGARPSCDGLTKLYTLYLHRETTGAEKNNRDLESGIPACSIDATLPYPLAFCTRNHPRSMCWYCRTVESSLVWIQTKDLNTFAGSNGRAIPSYMVIFRHRMGETVRLA